MALSLRFSNFFRSSQRFNSWKSHARNLTYTKKISDFSIFLKQTPTQQEVKKKVAEERSARELYILHRHLGLHGPWFLLPSGEWRER